MDLTESTLKEYLSKLCEKIPAPGGGSATALVLATGVALLNMCLEYSEKNFTPEELSLLERKIKDFLGTAVLLIQKDRDVYLKLHQALKDRGSNIDSVYKEAASVPLEMIRVCREVIEIMESNVKKINKNLFSDFKASLNFIKASFDSAKIFVEINLKHLSQSQFDIVNRLQTEETEKFISGFENLRKELRNGV